MPLSSSARKKKNPENQYQRNYSSCIRFNVPINICSVTNIKFDSRPQEKLTILNKYLSQHSLNPKAQLLSSNEKKYSKYNNFKITLMAKNTVLAYTQDPFWIDTQKNRSKKVVLHTERVLKKFPQRKVMSSMSYRNKKQMTQNKIKFSFPNPETELFKNNEIMKKFSTSSVFPNQNQLSGSTRSVSEQKNRVRANKLLPNNSLYLPMKNKNLALIGGTQSILINSKIHL